MQKLHEYEDEKRLEDIINEIIDLKIDPERIIDPIFI